MVELVNEKGVVIRVPEGVYKAFLGNGWSVNEKNKKKQGEK